MKPRELLDILIIAERLKDATRHCYTSGGRRESVAEHCWMTALAAMLISDSFPEADMNKVVKMCLIHDLGEAFTGDIPTFDKTDADEKVEEALLYDWVRSLPEKESKELLALYDEMSEKKSAEAKIYKALDGLEALIQHNLSDLSTWTEKERAVNATYHNDKVEFSEYFKELREEIKKDTLKKLSE